MNNIGMDSIVSSVIRTTLYCALAAGTALIVVIEVGSKEQPMVFNESSMIERLHLLYLCVCIAMFSLSAKIKSSRMSLSVLLAGMALLALVRELDNFFDNYVFDGAWQIIALLVALATGFFVFKHRQGLKSSIQEFASKASFGYMTSAFIVLFVFSRMIGKQLLWKTVMGENYLRIVKTLVEESTELFGYALLVIAAMEFYRESKRAGQD